MSCKPLGPLEAGRDFYLEDGKMVFTADFLRRRGYCCESACRHCPYGFTREMWLEKQQKLQHDGHEGHDG